MEKEIKKNGSYFKIFIIEYVMLCYIVNNIGEKSLYTHNTWLLIQWLYKLDVYQINWEKEIWNMEF